MLSLNAPQWQEFTSGYQLRYDASEPLKRLEANSDSASVIAVLDELWDELYHQGDIGTASYLAVPQLVRIGLINQLIDWRLLGLIALIEIQRHESTVLLPKQYEDEYFAALQQVEKLIAVNTAHKWDREYSSCALAALAASKGQIAMARVAQEFSDPDLSEKFEEFLDNY